MALAASYFTVKESATTGNVNGGGFNPANANMLTDLACDTGTGNTASPIVSSASYNFVAGDVGYHVYIKAGTNWTPGWYEIASVATNKATLKAAVGEAQQYLNTLKKLNTVAGCATTGTPTGGTFSIDYSQGDSAIATATDLTCTAASTTISSASAPFKNVMVGNIIHLTALTGAGAITGWYEIVSYTSTSSVVVDRTPTNGVNNITAGTYYIGGAARLNGLEDAMFESYAAGTKTYIKAGTYNVSAAVSITTGIGTAANLNQCFAYTTIPGDYVIGSPKPLLNMGNASFTYGNYYKFFNIDFTGTPPNVIVTNATNYTFNSKITNTSNTANRSAASGVGYFDTCEFVSQFGNAFSHTGSSATTRLRRCYAHDSVIGFNLNSTDSDIVDCVVANCTTAAIRNASTTANLTFMISNNTIYGRATTPVGIGIDFTSAASSGNVLKSNIISYCATGINSAALTEQNMSLGNNFYGNTADVTNFYKYTTDTALDPQFTDISEIAISNGTLTGGTAVLTSSGADFSSVEDGVDYFTWISHTGGTGTFIGSYLITSHTLTTLTFNINAGSSGSVTGITGYIQTGHNFAPGTNMKALDSYSFGSAFTSYQDEGGVQRQESGSATTVGSISFF